MNKFSKGDERDVMIFMLVVIFPSASVVNLNILMSENPLITFLVDGHRQFVGNHEDFFLSVSVPKRHFRKHKFTCFGLWTSLLRDLGDLIDSLFTFVGERLYYAKLLDICAKT